LVVGSRARGHYCDGALTSLLSGHCSLGAVFLRWSLTSRRQIEIRARGLYSEGSTLWQQPPVWIFAVFNGDTVSRSSPGACSNRVATHVATACLQGDSSSQGSGFDSVREHQCADSADGG